MIFIADRHAVSILVIDNKAPLKYVSGVARIQYHVAQKIEVVAHEIRISDHGGAGVGHMDPSLSER